MNACGNNMYRYVKMAYQNHDYIALVCEAGLLIQGKDRGRLGGNRSLTHSELWVKCHMSYVNNNYIAIIDDDNIAHHYTL